MLERLPLRHARSDALLAGQEEVLGMIHDDRPLSEVLEKLCRVIEAEAPGTMASILLIDSTGRHLLLGAAPSLPEAFTRASHGLSIGVGVGSCGHAAATGEPCMVTDIAVHPNWAAFRELAVNEAGLRSSWSVPIKSYDGSVIATFALYGRAPKAPSLAERKLLDFSSHLVAIAVNRHRDRECLQEGVT